MTEIRSIDSGTDCMYRYARWRYEAFFDPAEDDYSESEQQVADHCADRGPWAVLGALREGHLVGGAMLVPRELMERDYERAPWLAAIYVVEAARGQGIGRLLVQAVEAAARDRGFATVSLYTIDKAPFYARCGWRSVETFDYDDGETYILMDMRL